MAYSGFLPGGGEMKIWREAPVINVARSAKKFWISPPPRPHFAPPQKAVIEIQQWQLISLSFLVEVYSYKKNSWIKLKSVQ